MLNEKLNGRTDGADFDVGETCVKIGILIVWTGIPKCPARRRTDGLAQLAGHRNILFRNWLQ